MTEAARPTIVLPWHESAFARLRQRANTDHLAQTLIIQAPDGTGLAHFADVVTGWLLCQGADNEDRPCSQCRGCMQWQAASHPDVFTLAPEGVSDITIEQVRECMVSLSLARHYRGYRVVRLEPAEALNRNAANAFLKTLEEPATGTIFLLLTAQARSLPATVRSRAQIMVLPSPTEAQAKAWLSAQGIENTAEHWAFFSGQPLRAMGQGLDPQQHQKFCTILDLSSQKSSQFTEKAKSIASTRDEALQFLEWLATQQWREALTAIANGADAQTPLAIYRLGLQARAALRANTPPQLAVESLLISCQSLQQAQSVQKPHRAE